VTLLAEIFLLWKWKPLSVKPKFDFTILKEINKVGLPIFIVGIIFSLWSTIQNTFVLKFGGAEQFGLFQLALMVETSLGVVVFSVSQVVYPKMAFEYGKGKDIKDLLQVSFKPILFIFILLVPSIFLGWILLPYAVNWLLPKYVNGVGAAQWTMLLLFISIWAVNNNIFNVIKKQGDFLISIIAGMLVYTAALLILHRYEGFSLKHFPQAMFIGKCSQLFIGYLFIWRYLKSK
jgi:O-antigen/teichoic acid export membrane protein